jgi:hypothetical protein
LALKYYDRTPYVVQEAENNDVDDDDNNNLFQFYLRIIRGTITEEAQTAYKKI